MLNALSLVDNWWGNRSEMPGMTVLWQQNGRVFHLSEYS